MGVDVVGLGPARFATKQNTAGQVELTSVTATDGGVADAYGSWVQVTASTATEYYIVAVAVFGPVGSVSNYGSVTVDVGRGGAGSEVSVGTAIAVGATPAGSPTNMGPGGVGPLFAASRVSSGSRLAVRVKVSGGASGSGFRVTVLAVPYVNVDGN